MANEISQILLKRGTTAKAVAYTGPIGEVLVDTDLKALRVQDGVTAGGHLVSKEGHVHTFASLTSKPTTLSGYGITDAQPLDADLTAYAALTGTGLVSRTGDGTVAARSIAVSGTGLSVTNANGLAGNPTITSNATNLNTGSAVVARDASGNFAAGTITASLAGNASTADALKTARTLSLTGDGTGSASFDGSANAAIALTLADSGVTAGTFKSVTVDAKGRVTAGTNPTTLAGYGITDAQPLDADLTAIAALAGVSGFLKKTAANTWTLDTSAYLTGNQNVSITGDATGSGTTSITLTLAPSGVAAGSYTSVTVDAKGRVISGSNPTTLSGYGITDAAPLIHTHDLDLLGDVAIATKLNGDLLTWNGAKWANTAQSALAAGTAAKLATARTISASGDASGSTSFDGSANVSLSLTLANSGVTAGTYGSATQVVPFTVDAKGRVTAAGAAVTITPAWGSITSKPTTLAGYGITDAQPLDADLTAIAALAGTSGLLKKTAANTWTLDTSAYLTGNQTITVSGDASGSGTTAIALTLANSGVTAGTYKSVTVDAKGRVTAGTNPTTLSGYGITDAAPINSPALTGVPTAPTAAAGTSTTQLATTAFVGTAINNALNAGTQAGSFSSITTSGDANLGGNLVVTGNLTVNGTTTTVNSTTIMVDDPIITIGGDTAPTLDDGKDRGIEFRWHNGTSAKLGFFGFDDSTGYLTFIPDATNTSEVFSGTKGTIDANLLGSVTGNASTATKLATARTISVSGDATGSASFDGSANAAIALTLANSGVTAGTFKTVTVDAKGRVTAGSNPTTLSGFGITDAYTKTEGDARYLQAGVTIDGGSF